MQQLNQTVAQRHAFILSEGLHENLMFTQVNSGSLLNFHGGAMLNNNVINSSAVVIVRRSGQVSVETNLHHACDYSPFE